MASIASLILLTTTLFAGLPIFMLDSPNCIEAAREGPREEKLAEHPPNAQGIAMAWMPECGCIKPVHHLRDTVDASKWVTGRWLFDWPSLNSVGVCLLHADPRM